MQVNKFYKLANIVLAVLLPPALQLCISTHALSRQHHIAVWFIDHSTIVSSWCWTCFISPVWCLEFGGGSSIFLFIFFFFLESLWIPVVVDENQQIEQCVIIFYSALLQDSVEVHKYINMFCVVRNTIMTASTSEVF